MTEAVTIRKVVAAEAAEIKSIERECGLSPWPEEFYRGIAADPNYVFIAAVSDKEIAGFACTRLITAEKNPLAKTQPSSEAEILNIAVLKPFRGRGIGASLLKQMVEQLMEFRPFSVFLEVRESNIAARRFYSRNGFTETGRRHDYYQKPLENAILMSLDRM